MFIIPVLISLLFLIPFTIILTYFLLGVTSIVIGMKEKNTLKVKSGAKTILYAVIAFVATLLIWEWVVEISIKDVFHLFDK
jgi:uncharacterized membrane protein